MRCHTPHELPLKQSRSEINFLIPSFNALSPLLRRWVVSKYSLQLFSLTSIDSFLIE